MAENLTNPNATSRWGGLPTQWTKFGLLSHSPPWADRSAFEAAAAAHGTEQQCRKSEGFRPGAFSAVATYYHPPITVNVRSKLHEI